MDPPRQMIVITATLRGHVVENGVCCQQASGFVSPTSMHSTVEIDTAQRCEPALEVLGATTNKMCENRPQPRPCWILDRDDESCLIRYLENFDCKSVQLIGGLDLVEVVILQVRQS